MIKEKENSINADEIESRYQKCVQMTKKKLKYDQAPNDFVFALACHCNRAGIPQDAALYHVQSDFNHDDKAVKRAVKNAYKNVKEFGTSGNQDKAPSKIDIIEAYLMRRYRFRFNEITARPEYIEADGGEFVPLTDFVENSILRDLQKNNIKCGLNTLRNILHSDFSPMFNPFKDYFENLPAWDGKTDHIAALADTVTTTHQELWHKCFKKWITAMVASALVPEIINHTVIIFSGAQGIGKTTWMEALVPLSLKKYLYSGTVNPASKDSLLHLIECILINLDELENLNRTEIGTLKELITKTNIRLRRAYGHNNESYPRRASLMGSVNMNQFLNDTTGSRRFLSFEVLKIQYQHKLSLEMVFAQAMHLFRSGFQYWLSSEDIKEVSLNNENYQIRTIEEELLLTRFEKADRHNASLFLTASQMLTRINEHSRVSVTTGNVIALGKALKKHGFERIKKGGILVYPVNFIDASQEQWRNSQKPEEDKEAPDLFGSEEVPY